MDSVVSRVGFVPALHLASGSETPQRPAVPVEAKDDPLSHLILSLKAEQHLMPAIAVEVLDQKIGQTRCSRTPPELEATPVYFLPAEILQPCVVSPQDTAAVVKNGQYRAFNRKIGRLSEEKSTEEKHSQDKCKRSDRQT